MIAPFLLLALASTASSCDLDTVVARAVPPRYQNDVQHQQRSTERGYEVTLSNATRKPIEKRMFIAENCGAAQKATEVILGVWFLPEDRDVLSARTIPEEAPAPRRLPLSFRLAARAGAGFGSLPDPVYGSQIELGVQLVRARLSIRWAEFLSTRIPLTPDLEGVFKERRLGAALCAVVGNGSQRFVIGPQATLAYLEGQGTGLSLSQSAQPSIYHWGGGLSLAFEQRIWSTLELTLAGQASYAPTAPEFAVDGVGVVLRSGRFLGALFFGVEVSI